MVNDCERAVRCDLIPAEFSGERGSRAGELRTFYWGADGLGNQATVYETRAGGRAKGLISRLHIKKLEGKEPRNSNPPKPGRVDSVNTELQFRGISQPGVARMQGERWRRHAKKIPPPRG